ncbi:ABC transporter substrate-binding protein [Labrys monachus]|uniref:Polar amino acid transport system substrate-binding protein n=1 Tax=Labrys monachus TaxID=217067 RepID=A0ABU0FGP0_9HYPH|nr:ABC transporter substrate-binding protein [Labrys monachus]MDQ0393631.1 polar amino acid transport system substrate-binding protein [Labrys monachus]
MRNLEFEPSVGGAPGRFASRRIRAALGAAAVALAAVAGAGLAGPTKAWADDAITAAVKTDPALHALLPKAIQDAGVIKLATDAHYPPCESFAEDNVTMVGWEPDLWEALGKKMGVKFVASSIDFDGLIPGVQSGRFDTAMECISDTPARQKQVTFVDLSISVNGIFTLEGSPVTNDPLSLCGLKTAAQKGTTFGQSVDDVLNPFCLKHNKPAIAKSEFPTADATLLALFSGRVDFLVNDASSAAEIKKRSSRPLKLFTPDILPRKIDGFVVKRDNMELAKALLAGVEALIADGVYDKVMDKWDLAALKVDKPGINLGSPAPKP